MMDTSGEPALLALVILGGLGNVLAVAVLSLGAMRSLASTRFVLLLTVSDTVFLGGVLMLYAGWDVRHDWACKFKNYIFNTAAWLSAWATLAMSCERFMAIFYPLKKMVMCDRGSIHRIIAVILVPLPLLANLYTLWVIGISSEIMTHVAVNGTFTSVANVCTVLPDYVSSTFYANVLDSTMVFVLPAAGVSLLNMALLCKLCKHVSAARRQRHTGGKSSEDGGGAPVATRGSVCNGTGGAVRHRLHTHRGGEADAPGAYQQLTALLIVVPLVYVLLNAPSYMLRMHSYVSVLHSDGGLPTRPSNLMQTAFHMSKLLNYTCYAIDAPVYALCSRLFRQNAVSLFRRLTSRRQTETTSSNMAALAANRMRHRRLHNDNNNEMEAQGAAPAAAGGVRHTRSDRAPADRPHVVVRCDSARGVHANVALTHL